MGILDPTATYIEQLQNEVLRLRKQLESLRSTEQDWVSVPREPTYEMVQAGAKLVADNRPYHTGTKAIYEAMLAAAPSANAGRESEGQVPVTARPGYGGE